MESNADKVQVLGPGVESEGVVGEFASEFNVQTEGAGPGRLGVHIRGPKGIVAISYKLFRFFLKALNGNNFTEYKLKFKFCPRGKNAWNSLKKKCTKLESKFET